MTVKVALAEVRPAAPSITCPVCGMTSYHPDDIANGYCGNCHAYTRPVKYEVSAIPPAMRDKPWSEAHYWTLSVEYRSDSKGWGVFRDHGTYCLRRDGRRWAWPSNARGRGRGERWIRAYRMPLEEALALAVKHAPKLRFGRFNYTAQDFIDRELGTGETEEGK